MAEVTQRVCDACGKADKLEVLNLEVTNGLNVTLDVHNRKRCISAAVKTAVEKHFAVNGVAAPTA